MHHADPLKADSDADGIPDDWAVAHGLSPNDAADAAVCRVGVYVGEAYYSGVLMPDE